MKKELPPTSAGMCKRRYDRQDHYADMLNGYMPVTLDELIENNSLFRRQKTIIEDNGG